MDEYSNLPLVDLSGNPVEEEDYSKLPVVSLPTTNPASTPKPVDQEDYSQLPLVSVKDYKPGGEAAPEEFSTKESMAANPEEMDTIRNYMIGRKGTHINHLKDDEMVEKFVNHMRYINSNEIDTFGEYRYIQGASDEEKARVAEAYKVYDKLGNISQTNDYVDGIKDYGWSILTAPSTYIGGVVGGRVAGKVATEAVMTAAKQALKTGGKEGAKQVLRSAAIANVAKRTVVAGGVDAGTATLADSLLQSNDIELGRQESYDPVRGTIAAVAGSVPGAVASVIPQATAVKNLSGLRGMPDGHKRFKIKKATDAKTTVAPRIKEAVNTLALKLKTWEDYTTSGKALNPSRDEVEAIVSDFLDIENPNSITRIVIDSGANLDLADDVRFTEQVLDFAGQLPQKNLDEYNDILKPTGYTFGQLIDVVADASRLGGQNLNKAARAKIYAKSLGQLAKDTKAASDSLLNDPYKEIPPSPRTVEYATSLWRRALVSHPTTSMINVAGWAQAVTGRAAGELAQAGYLGVIGLGGKLVGKGSPQLAAANALRKNQTFKLRTLIDPYSSRDAWEAIVNAMPSGMKKQVNMNLFGGVGETGPELYNVKPNMATNALEKYVDVAGRVSLLKFQDELTKSFSGLWAMDKQLRLKYGKGLDDIIANGEYDLITDDVAKEGVKSLLSDTFSADVVKASPDDDSVKRLFKTLGRSVEAVSNAPYAGFLFPFGKFLTNNLAFLHEYGPTGLIHSSTRIFKDEPWTLQEKMARGSVGTLALGYLAANTMEDQKQGKPWYGVEGSDSTLHDVRNMAPGSTYLLVGRILGNIFSEEGNIHKDFVLQMADQLGTASWARNLDNTTDIGKVIEWWKSIETPEEADLFASTMNAAMTFVLEDAAPVAAGLGGNMLRPLDPINDIVGMGTGSDVAIDKKMADTSGEESLNNLSRYTANFFAPFLGRETTEDGSKALGTPKRIATERGDLKDPNPLSTLFGMKELPPTNNINKLLNSLNMPAYLLDSRTADPEFDHFLNETIFPMLDGRAKNLLESEIYKKASPEKKFSLSQNMFTDAEKDSRELLENGFIDGSALANERRKWSLLPLVDRNEAKERFGITKEDRDLTQSEIDVMKYYMKKQSEFEKQFGETLKQ